MCAGRKGEKFLEGYDALLTVAERSAGGVEYGTFIVALTNICAGNVTNPLCFDDTPIRKTIAKT